MKSMLVAAFMVGLCIGTPMQAFAAGRDAALERCKTTVGRPNVMACMQGGGNLESCKEQTKPKVRACVMRAMGR